MIPPSSAGALLLVLGVGCGGAPPGSTQNATETDGVVTTGVDEGVDETGVEPPYFCIYNTDNPEGYVGVKHECGLEYDLDITFTVALVDGSSFQVPISAFAVQTLNESTYEHPYVMACCSAITDHPDWPFDDSCDTLHHEACMSDFLEHICDAPGVWLEAASHDYSGQGKEAIEAAADWFKNHRNECYDHFWTGPDALSSANLCDPDFDGFFDHTPWEPSQTWSFVDPITGTVIAQVSNVIVAPRSSFGTSVPQDPPNPAESCAGPESNNGETPPLAGAGTTGTLVSPVAPVPINVAGPKLNGEVISGGGQFGTESTVRWHVDSANALEIERWVMVENSAATVGTSSVQAGVDGFKLDLLGSETAGVIAGGWQIGAGSALFNMIATVDGIGSNVQATNSGPIKLYSVNGGVGACPTHVASCLVSRPFTIAYQDALGQSWELDIPTTTWNP